MLEDTAVLFIRNSLCIRGICFSWPSDLGSQCQSSALDPSNFFPSTKFFVSFPFIFISVVESIFDKAPMLRWCSQMKTNSTTYTLQMMFRNFLNIVNRFSFANLQCNHQEFLLQIPILS